MYRICKQFEFQAAHILSKHPGKCKYPHGHSYKIEVTLVADKLDENEMVCDFHAISAIVKEYIEKLDHAIMLNSADMGNCVANEKNPRRIVFDNQDPTSEVLARKIFEHIESRLQEKKIRSANDVEFKINPSARIEKVRVWETSTAWAEYSHNRPSY